VRFCKTVRGATSGFAASKEAVTLKAVAFALRKSVTFPRKSMRSWSAMSSTSVGQPRVWMLVG